MNYKLEIREIILETFILTGKIYEEELLKKLIDKVKKTKDSNLSYKTNVKGHFTGFKSLVEDENFHSFLKLIQPYIKVIYNKNFTIDDAWGNILKKGEEVTEHNHNSHVFCGILYLSENGPGTYFRGHDITVKEEIGKFVLFDSKLLHSVKKIEDDIERITIAFNMGGLNSWQQDLNKLKWVNKNEI
jgi:hypothetical protein